MQKAILTLSKNTTLIEQIRSNLEEGGRFYVQGVTSAHGSLAMVRHRIFDVAILDLDQSDLTATQLVYNLKKIQPEIRILIFAPENLAVASEIDELPIDGLLRKPFFAPELSDLLKGLFKVAQPERTSSGTELPKNSIENGLEPLAEDSIDEMSQLLAKTSAVSSMIFREGVQVSQSASFSPAESQRVADFIEKKWKSFKNLEICRFIRTDGVLDSQIVYALPLGGDSLLVFTYPASVDLRRIRQETSKVRDAYMIGRYSRLRSEDSIPVLSISQNAQQELELKEAESSSTLSDIETLPAAPESDRAQWILEFDDVEVPAEPSASNAPKTSLADTQPVAVHRGEPTPQAEESPVQTSVAAQESVIPVETASRSEDQPQAPEDEKPLSTYHCLIVPADGKIMLTQKLGEKTSALIRELHSDQGWLLAYLTVRPLYAFWTVRLPAESSPAKVIDAVKNSTSKQLAAEFPEMAGGDAPFWAPGYWVLSGGQPPSGRVIEQFLRFRSQKHSDAQERR